MRLRSALLIVCLALPGSVCGGPSPEEHAPLTLQLELGSKEEATGGVPKFAANRAIPIRMSLVNHSDSEARLPFSSGQTHDVVVLDESGADVWRWSNGRMFTQMLQEIPLAAGARRDVELACDPAQSGAEGLPPGRYRAIGVIPVTGAEIRSEPIVFEVR